MCPIVYLIRPSEQSIARSVCLKDASGVALSLGDTHPPGKVHDLREQSSYQRDETLSYDQVLSLLLTADKIITL